MKTKILSLLTCACLMTAFCADDLLLASEITQVGQTTILAYANAHITEYVEFEARSELQQNLMKLCKITDKNDVLIDSEFSAAQRKLTLTAKIKINGKVEVYGWSVDAR